MEPTRPLNDWQGQPYFPISQHYHQRFGCKVYKISVAVAESCPNREAAKGEVCIFCDEWGSAANQTTMSLSLSEQILHYRSRLAQRYKAKGFLVYFQAYTNTFGRIRDLEQNLRLALAQDQVVGLVLGTRPDCLPKGVFPLFADLAQETYLSVELGVQSLVDQRLEFLKRGHNAQCSLEAMQRLAAIPQLEVGLHLMFGLPGETEAELVQTARQINALPVANVKLHNLHVLTRTPLAELYRQGGFVPLELEDYSKRVIPFLEHLSPHTPVQRLAAVSGRWDELIAPLWTRDKLAPMQYICNRMRQLNTWQGKLWQE